MRCFRQALPVLLSGWVLAGAPSAAADCGLVTVTATTVDFHRYRPSDPQPKDAVGELRVQCSGFGTDSTDYAVTIDSRAGDGGRRQMTGTGGYLAYDLFLDAARTQVWGGDGDTGSQARGRVEAERPEGNRHPVYGRIFPLQNVAPGEYSDRVTITVFF